ncbi:hypothetical protein Moror_7066 [Moniliophthora roreri MCA 2997]|uniref:MYND-type domain-containing protein n=1 Tax=Moniliophthora roreri (strain MCA 2997) TaxID=1381753 RepID=V2XUR5_MONRO|nr:hypothetical protein Moror_7066 [Moniliophthora roreri MCA 2997]
MSSAKKSKKKPAPKRPPAEYIGNIENARDWNEIVLILCDVLELPELTTRSGLRKVHANLEGILARLDQIYESNAGNEKITGGVVGICAKMCADGTLRNKLLERGFLSKLLPLLDRPYCRHMALRSMSSIAHHGAERVNLELAKQTPILLRLLDELSDDPVVAELIISIMSHTLSDIMRKHEKVGIHTPYTPPFLEIRPLLDALLKQLKNPRSSDFLVDHAIALLAVLAYHCGPTMKADPSVTNFLIAGLRSRSWQYRCQCLGGLVRMHRHLAEEDVRFFDPNTYLKMLGKPVPDHIANILSGYGTDKTDMFFTSKATYEGQMALRKMAISRDKDRIYPYGLSLSGLILETEWSVTDGWLEGPDPLTGQIKEAVLGFPFNRLRDALPHCAALIRAKGNPSEADKADTLDIKYLILVGDNMGAAELAYKALQRNPDFAYYYYAISLLADRREGLRGAKKGLKCTQTSPFVRNQLRQRAVEHAAELGMASINEAGDKAHLWEEGIALLMSALEDSKTFIKEASPDNRQMRNVLYWNILLAVLTRGPDASSDLSEAQASLMKLKFTDDFSEYMQQPPPKTQLRLTQQTFVKNYRAAIAEWGDIVVNHQGFQDRPVEPKTKTDDDLAAWLDDLKLENGEQEPSRCHPKVNTNHVALYQCSWCYNPSAVLRKCAGCGLTRYCDIGCQKSHWSAHKKQCKTASSKAAKDGL